MPCVFLTTTVLTTIVSRRCYGEINLTFVSMKAYNFELLCNAHLRVTLGKWAKNDIKVTLRTILQCNKVNKQHGLILKMFQKEKCSHKHG